jgi:hypothetical protein
MSTVWRGFRAHGRRVAAPDVAAPSPRVDRMLSSLRAPASPDELLREDDALTVFHRAHLARVHSPGSASPPPLAARRGLRAAFASAGVVALLSAGVAFAGVHADLSHDSAPPGAGSTHISQSSRATHSAHPAQPSGRPTHVDPSHSTGPNEHAYGGLCRAYMSGNKAERGKALASPAFSVLVTAAGGAGNVTAYCGAVTHGPSGGHPSHPAHPTQAANPAHPAHPTHPGHPTHPAHPAAPAHPGHG